MKFKTTILLFAIVLALFSCSQSTKKNEAEEEIKPCDYENDIELTITDYYYSMSDTLIVENYKFEVKQSEMEWINDTTISLKLKNYSEEEFNGRLAENQYDILIGINARQGKKISDVYYAYLDYQSGLWCQVNIVTCFGEVYFNWLSGMPAQGGITIDYVDKDNICGVFNLNVENLDSPLIGIVKLNGKFTHTKD